MPFLLPHLVLACTTISFWLGGYALWVPTVIIFILFPLIELLTQAFVFENKKNIDSAKLNQIADLSLYLMPLHLTFILFFSFSILPDVTVLHEHIGLVLSTGIVLGAFGITSAHELVHRRVRWQRALGVYSLMTVNFAHWGIEHVFGHHKNVATKKDPATARRNEIIYIFWIREYFSSLVSAFKINFKKCSYYFLASVFISLVLYVLRGMNYLIFWWSVSLVAILLLQTVDYIEHYGLIRPLKADGSVVPFAAEHAWDTSSYLTNWVLFNLGFHSHHHFKASVSFTVLEPQPTARQLPVGYSFMVILALMPFIFIPIMNKRLKS